MDKETLSQYGWVVICIIVIVIMIALATPFGNYIYASAESAVKSFGSVVKQSFDTANIDYEEPTFNDGTTVGTPVLRGKNTGYVDEARGYVYGIPVGTSDLSGLFEVENGSFETPDGVRTGASLVVKKTDDSVYKTYTIIIFGDVTGDGLITEADCDQMYDWLIGAPPTSGPYFFAGDIDTNGILSLSDKQSISLYVSAPSSYPLTINPYA